MARKLDSSNYRGLNLSSKSSMMNSANDGHFDSSFNELPNDYDNDWDHNNQQNVHDYNSKSSFSNYSQPSTNYFYPDDKLTNDSDLIETNSKKLNTNKI